MIIIYIIIYQYIYIFFLIYLSEKYNDQTKTRINVHVKFRRENVHNNIKKKKN